MNDRAPSLFAERLRKEPEVINRPSPRFPSLHSATCEAYTTAPRCWNFARRTAARSPSAIPC